MAYRGHDLDLRTPQTWRDAQGAPASAGKGLNGPVRGRGHAGDEDIPIWVDDTVLACCNHAFDVALAHRSGEVRVEHLLHALTRIEDAAEILEANGIRAASLRRETATVIAGEIPVSLANGASTPRRSDSFEELLRLAAAHSYQRNLPVSVEDLLHVFLELRPAIRGLELIERHLVSHRRERTERPMPQFRRPAPPPFTPPPMETRFESRERVRRPAGRFYAVDAGYAPAAPMANNIQAVTDNLQNSRLDALEQMVHAVSGQIAGQRDDATRFTGDMFERLQTLETMMSSLPGGASGGSELLLRRIDDLEGLLSGRVPQAVDLTPVLDRMADLERRLGETGPVMADIDIGRLEQRLADIEARLAERISASQSDVGLKLADFERKSDLGDLSGRLELIEEALLGRDGEISGDIDSRVRDLAEAVSLQQATLEDVRASLAADVRDVNVALTEQVARITHTGESLTELVRAVESLRNEERNTVAQVASLLSAYRADVQEFVTHNNETHEVHNAELKEVHDALLKLNQNQHTLAGSFDQWRSDDAGDLAVIASRIEGLEQEAGRPMPLLQAMSVNLENINRYTVERYHRRNRFWYWLFGTDDWVAASWPSQSQRIEAERAALREAQSN